MSWYKDEKSKVRMIKTASYKLPKIASVPSVSTKLDWRDQSESYLWFGDIQRYVFDSQTVKVFLSRTSKKWAVSLMTNHTYIGTCGFSMFWTFDLNEGEKAKQVFKKVDKIAKETIQEFIKEEKPTSIFYPVLRNRLTEEIDKSDIIKTNIPSINYSYDLQPQGDWRESIYGTRYPSYKEESFKQYLNSTVYKSNKNKGKFAL